MRTVLLIVTGLSLGWGVGYLVDMPEQDSTVDPRFTTAIDPTRLNDGSTDLLWSVDLEELRTEVCYDGY
tara:strand:- start:2603 stop:2809 length:207 start_codon:yes stop_codon:yes gene_type:complete